MNKYDDDDDEDGVDRCRARRSVLVNPGKAGRELIVTVYVSTRYSLEIQS